ncbi:MAG: transposase [Cyanobacteria bacterium P01_A01_bin.114]
MNALTYSNITLSPDNTDNSKPVIDLLSSLSVRAFSDRAYMDEVLAKQPSKPLTLSARTPAQYENRLMWLTDKLLTRSRAIVEMVIDQLKNISQIEHFRHRSPTNCFVHIICDLIAYCHRSRKPKLYLDPTLPSGYKSNTPSAPTHL